LEKLIMNPRLAATTALCREVAIPALVLALIAGSGFAAIDRTAAAPMVDRLAQSLTADARFADAKFADKPQPIAPRTIELVTASIPNNFTDKNLADKNLAEVTQPASTNSTPAASASDPVVTAAVTDAAVALPPETAPEAKTNEAKTSMASLEPADVGPAASATEARDECVVADSCVDHYLWTLYQRTPKEDAVKIEERRQVTVKRKGKMVTVTRRFTKLTDEDFGWKDPKAAEHFGMPLDNYVVGGMDRDFKLKLVQMLRAADAAGLSPGITSAFRDDYRQSIATGLKAADNRSYHGGSLRGGYGHGLAADIVSVNGATRAERLNASETLWKWVDAHGMEFGIGRPYLGRDPPHVAPIDGKEYADHHPGMKARQARSAAKPGKKLVSGDDRSPAKHQRAAGSSKAGSSKVRTI
jgi:D-alanyl-D-alanine carboxypeptidase